MFEKCFLCGELNMELFSAQSPGFARCNHCKLVRKNPAAWLEASAEKARYSTHQNESDSSGYRNFLSRLAKPLAPHLKHHKKAMDFGSGKISLLAEFFPALEVSLYDPFFHPNEALWQQRYDLVFASEVFEHLYNPRLEIERLKECLAPNGLLAVMSSSYINVDFDQWFYRRDSTHVHFWCEESFAYVCKEFGFRLVESNQEYFWLLEKP